MHPDIAANLTAGLWEAHLRGVETHGIRRLAPYLKQIALGGIDGAAQPGRETRGGMVMVQGRNGLGHHICTLASSWAVDAAREHGVGLALVRDSNHFGFAGHYAVLMAQRGMVGLAISNGQALVSPAGGLRPIFSNNPLALAAPLPDGGLFELDMATSVISRAKIAMAMEQGESIAPGIACDALGNPTTDAAAAYAGNLLAFGAEKGFALLCALEILTGVLPGGAYADLVGNKENHPDAPEGTSQMLMAISLDHAMGLQSFQQNLGDLLKRLQGLPMGPGKPPPRYPGQRRWALRKKRLRQGVPLSARDLARLKDLVNRHGVEVEL